MICPFILSNTLREINWGNLAILKKMDLVTCWVPWMSIGQENLMKRKVNHGQCIWVQSSEHKRKTQKLSKKKKKRMKNEINRMHVSTSG